MRILVVEDQPRLAAAIRRGLEAEGFAVSVAHDGPGGLEAARRGGWDAVVLDILLPGMSGYKVCSTLREEGWDTPILMLSAKAGEYDEAEALDTGADDFLSKPFSYVVLVAHLRALLRRGPRRQAHRLVVGDLVLDADGHGAWRGEVAVALTPREMALLRFLMERPGQVVSKPDILDAVWDPDFDGDDNIVEVYVRYLRRKIDIPFGRSAIETVRGVGYRMAADGG